MHLRVGCTSGCGRVGIPGVCRRDTYHGIYASLGISVGVYIAFLYTQPVYGALHAINSAVTLTVLFGLLKRLGYTREEEGLSLLRINLSSWRKQEG